MWQSLWISTLWRKAFQFDVWFQEGCVIIFQGYIDSNVLWFLIRQSWVFRVSLSSKWGSMAKLLCGNWRGTVSWWDWHWSGWSIWLHIYICSTRFLHRAMGSKCFKIHRSNCCVPVYNFPADLCSDLSHMAKLRFVIVHRMMPSSSVSAFQKLTTQAFSAIYWLHVWQYLDIENNHYH